MLGGETKGAVRNNNLLLIATRVMYIDSDE
jgi:hypothetical protein